jgi:Zn finger protein HypA/HybF involved in hydrogenase expression
MAQAFVMIAAGTEAADAIVDVVTVPAVITCQECGAAGESTDMIAVCHRCNSVNVSVSGGEELILESVRYVADVVT